MSTRRTLTTAALALAAVAAPAFAAPMPTRATVVSVVDGDTVRVRAAGAVRTLNLLDARAPRAGACFATQATRRLRQLLPPGTRIGLAFAERRPTTAARTFRAQVIRGRGVVDMAMVSGGFATATANTLPSFRAAQNRARANGVGLWGACVAGTPAPAPAPAAPAPTPTPPAPTGLSRDQVIAIVAPVFVNKAFTTSSPGSVSSTTKTDLCILADTEGDTRFTSFNSLFNVGSGSINSESAGTWSIASTTGVAGGAEMVVALRPDSGGEGSRLTLTVVNGQPRVNGNAITVEQSQRCPNTTVTRIAPPPPAISTQEAQTRILTAFANKRITTTSTTSGTTAEITLDLCRSSSGQQLYRFTKTEAPLSPVTHEGTWTMVAAGNTLAQAAQISLTPTSGSADPIILGINRSTLVMDDLTATVVASPVCPA